VAYVEPSNGMDGEPVDAPAVRRRRIEARAQARRRWVARTITGLLLGSLALIVIVSIQRDREHRRVHVAALRAYIRPLNDMLARTSYLPAVWNGHGVIPTPPIPFRDFEYASDAMREYARQCGKPTVVAWGPRVPIVFGSTCRAVAVLEDGRVHVEWWTERRFVRERAAERDALDRAAHEELRRPGPF
jgi:hypothetical protein